MEPEEESEIVSKPYDDDVYDLAVAHLQSDPDLDDEDNRESLAIAIQDTIESWFYENQ